MKDAVAMTELEASQSHLHPGLDVAGEEDERLVADDVLEIGLEELEHEIQVGLG